MAQFAFPVNDEVLIDAHVYLELLGIRELGGDLLEELFLESNFFGEDMPFLESSRTRRFVRLLGVIEDLPFLESKRIR